MSAPESFIEMVRCQLVLIRRNADRAQSAFVAVESNHHDAPDALARGMESLDVTRDQIRELEADVQAAFARTMHTCTCGHTHYVHGDDA